MEPSEAGNPNKETCDRRHRQRMQLTQWHVGGRKEAGHRRKGKLPRVLRVSPGAKTNVKTSKGWLKGWWLATEVFTEQS